jgi:ATP-dependent helicase HrpB
VRDVRGHGVESESDGALLRSIHAAYADRLCRRRAPGDPRGVMADGAGVRLDAGSGVLDAELFVAVSIEGAADGERAERLVRIASAVRREWLPEDGIVTEEERVFDEGRETVVAVRRTALRRLTLDEVREGAPRDARTAEVLAAAAAERLDRALDLSAPAVAGLLARVRSLQNWMPELGLPVFDEEEIRDLLPALAAGRRSFEELRRAPLLDHLRGRLGWEGAQVLDRFAPERLAVPSGSRIRLAYEPGRPPVLAVRIQQMFGARETPTVAGGRVKVLLHLLAPNGRPQQVTDDLPSFWANTYERVRKDLRARYPKHAWPERGSDPFFG